ncbi:hypothetical protein ES711_00515 [Gelidibacter salicanalis]|uniref:Alpha-L-glutamate ligase-related protein ATP-grasp domain-containing protein n=1 Tax=Gelidibacter salicanalis TaxID=291193 RepID=A0A5C7AS56_9FLAO|nr:sugar-transfer associated ATP-grasp domain-containing protein [Gelidibacter salicanalis]TXE10429.1 hypothetical protein ES711_00515 [Gelidibacter salicanalis]
MSVYFVLKRLLTTHVLNSRKRFFEYNSKMNSRSKIQRFNHTNKTPQLKSSQVEAAKSYFKSQGYNLNNTYWHSYYTGLNNEFHVDYIPEDLFRSILSPRFNEMRQWPFLLDKNLSYILFKDVNQPSRVIQNINGFYYRNNQIVPEQIAIEACNIINKPLVIKPTIDSGRGKQVNTFTIKAGVTSYKNLTISQVFKLYKKDFIIQEFVEQNSALKALNPSSLNTIRIMTYLRPNGVYVLSSVLRIGQPGSQTDNYSGGGIIIGIDKKGYLKNIGYTKKGTLLKKTHTNVLFEGFQIPNYSSVIKMIYAMHPIVPYFKFVSWDIGIDKTDAPIFIEFNTYNQNIDIHQITNGPLFGKFTNEILELGLKTY